MEFREAGRLVFVKSSCESDPPKPGDYLSLARCIQFIFGGKPGSGPRI